MHVNANNARDSAKILLFCVEVNSRSDDFLRMMKKNEAPFIVVTTGEGVYAAGFSL